jgi:hypothetical protein
MLSSRREFFGLLGAAVVATPAIVSSLNIMPVRTPVIWRPAKKVLTPEPAYWALVGRHDYLDCAYSNGLLSRLEFVKVLSWQQFVGTVPKLSLSDSLGFDCQQDPTAAYGLDGSSYMSFDKPTTIKVVVGLRTALQYQPGDIVDLVLPGAGYAFGFGKAKPTEES